MANYNRVILIGNLTRDIEIRHTTNTKLAVCQNAIAVNDRRKNAAGEWVDETTFVDVTFFGRMAELGGLDGVMEVALEGLALRVGVRSMAVVGPVLEWLGANGAVVEHIRTERPTLETVFLHLTGRTLRDA